MTIWDFMNEHPVISLLMVYVVGWTVVASASALSKIRPPEI